MSVVICVAYVTVFTLLMWGIWREDRRDLERIIRDALQDDLGELEDLADVTRERYLCRCIHCSDQRDALYREMGWRP